MKMKHHIGLAVAFFIALASLLVPPHISHAASSGYPTRPRFQAVGISTAPDPAGGLKIAVGGGADPWLILPGGGELSFYSASFDTEVILRPDLGFVQRGADDVSLGISTESTNATLNFDIGVSLCATVIATSQCETGAGLAVGDVLVSAYDTDAMTSTGGGFFFSNDVDGPQQVCLINGAGCPATEFGTTGVDYDTGDCTANNNLGTTQSQIDTCTENGTGDITLTLSTPYATAPICTASVRIADTGLDRIAKVYSVAAGSIRVITFDEDGNNVDADVMILCNGAN